jgi:plastocyanin
VFTSLTLAADSVAVEAGSALQLSVTPRDQDGTAIAGLPAAGWIIEDTALAGVSAGVVSGKVPGNTRILVRLTVEGVTHGDTARLTVLPAGAGGPAHPVSISGTSFVPPSITVIVGDSVTWLFSGAVHNVLFANPAQGSLNIPDQAPGGTVSRSFLAAGTSAYECTRHANMAGQVIVRTGQVQQFTSVGIAPATTNLLVGGTVTLVATPLDQAGVPMTGLPAATYLSQAPGIVSGTGQGVATAVAAGTTTVPASITSGGVSHVAVATVIVTAPAPGGVSVTATGNNTFSPATVTIAAGGSVTWQFGNGTHNVTCSSGLPPGGSIPDLSAGPITRSFPVAGSFTYECTRHNGMTGTVTVTGGGASPVYSTLSVAPASPLVAVGGTLAIIATPLAQFGAPMAGLPAATFSSSDPAVATVAAAGTVTGVSAGVAGITVSLTAGGVTRTGMSVVTVGTSLGVVISTANLTFTPDDVRIPRGRASPGRSSAPRTTSPSNPAARRRRAETSPTPRPGTASPAAFRRPASTSTSARFTRGSTARSGSSSRILNDEESQCRQVGWQYCCRSGWLGRWRRRGHWTGPRTSRAAGWCGRGRCSSTSCTASCAARGRCGR